jgi:hypothetical protein
LSGERERLAEREREIGREREREIGREREREIVRVRAKHTVGALPANHPEAIRMLKTQSA